jgi:hypothetical protein
VQRCCTTAPERAFGWDREGGGSVSCTNDGKYQREKTGSKPSAPRPLSMQQTCNVKAARNPGWLGAKIPRNKDFQARERSNRARGRCNGAAEGESTGSLATQRRWPCAVRPASPILPTRWEANGIFEGWGMLQSTGALQLGCCQVQGGEGTSSATTDAGHAVERERPPSAASPVAVPAIDEGFIQM